MKRVIGMLMAGLLLVLAPACALAQQEELIALAEGYIMRLLEGNAADVFAMFTPDMQAAVPLEVLEALPAQFEALGPFAGFSDKSLSGRTVTMRAEFGLMNMIAQLAFDENDLIAGLGFSPDQTMREIAMGDNEEAAVVGPYGLPGTLTMPETAEKVPAVVLVHGSGPQDRNEAIGDSAIFHDLAMGLSARGIAVLRYDKRAYAIGRGDVAYTQQQIDEMTVYEDTVEDALAAVALLKADPRVDPSRVFVIGHSQGAMLAPDIQAEGAGAAGLVLLAGTLRPMTALVADQLGAISADVYAAEIETANKLPDMTEEEARAAKLIGTSGYFFWDEARRDKTAIAAACDAPMLILQGSEDVQVYADVDFALWEQFAKERPEKDIALHLYPGLGHMFTIDGAFSPEVLLDIADWILAR